MIVLCGCDERVSKQFLFCPFATDDAPWSSSRGTEYQRTRFYRHLVFMNTRGYVVCLVVQTKRRAKQHPVCLNIFFLCGRCLI